jgi:alpha-tubulin suppressor-like RCC1 family protein
MPKVPFSARLLRLTVHALLACAALAASALHAQGLEATFNTAADIPLTVPSYTASGTVTLTLGFAPLPGTNLTLIKNTGLPFIDGQFTNLPNGSTVNLTHAGTPYPFIAWYYGGDGNNDLVLLWPFTGLAAWGYNSSGQLGDNSKTNRLVPVNVVQAGALLGKTIVQVSRGVDHSLALCSDGTVAAWGWNGYGQLGDNSLSDRLVPVAVNVAAGTSALAGKIVVAVAAGGYHSLALCSDGTVATWGYNNSGQLGENSTTHRRVPVAVNVLAGTSALAGKRVVAIAAGYYHNLALCDDGMVAAWGNNQFGHLGNNSTTHSPVPVAVNAEAGTSALAGKTVVAVAAGVDHSIALCSDGKVVAWGYGIVGQLGTLNPMSGVVPVAVNKEAGTSALFGKSVVAIAAGHSHNLALCSDGTVAAWGDNVAGPLGDGSSLVRSVPVAVSVRAGDSALSGKTVVAIAAGVSHSMALCSDGTMAAWGAGNYGQLGNSGTTKRHFPVEVNRAAGTSVLAGKQIYGLSHGSAASHSMVIYGQETHPMVTQSTANLAINATMLTITGIGFDAATPGNTTVAFTPAGTGTVTVATPTSLTITNLSGLSLGALHAVVTINGQSSGSAVPVATVVPAPPTVSQNLTSLDSLATALIITGTGFDASTPGNNTVAFTPAGTGTVTASTATTLTVSVSGLTTGALNAVVTTNGHTSGAPVQVATVLPAPPVITPNTSNLPIHATTLIISGTGFDANTPENNTVAFSPTGTGTVTSATATSVTVNLTGHGTGPLYAVITTNGQSTGTPVQVAEVVAPEIAVTGNGMDIPHDDTTPATADGTHYRNVALLNGRVSHTFSLANKGTLALHLTGTPLVTLSGPEAAAFEVTIDPASTVEAGSSTTFAITFDPTLPGPHTATVTIHSDAANHPGFSFAISGFGAVGTVRAQTITFAPPATVYLGQSPLSLSAHASSGLPVTMSVLPVGTMAAGAAIVDNALSFTGTGTVKVQAVQAGGGNYAAAPVVVKTITVKANPTALTLVNLAQTYTGTPRSISTLGGTGVVTVEYKLGPAFGSTEPTNAGSYSVRATDSKGTKTGKLVIARAPIYVTPDDQWKFVGENNPPLTLRYSLTSDGLVTTAPVLKTTATKSSVGGVYPITASGGVVSPNFAFIYQKGVLVVDSFAGSYEALLMNSGDLVGKLALTVSAANTSFTGKLYCQDEKTALSLKGPLVTNPGIGSVAGSATVASSGIPYVVSITALINGMIYANVTRDGSAYADTSTGRRSLAVKAVPYSGAHTAVLEPATPAANDVPAGAGWATAAISTKGVMTLAGRLGDGTSFTTSLTPDDASDPTYRLFLQPYKSGSATRLQSYLGGAFTLLPRPALAWRRYVEAAALSWAKAGLTTDATYSAGFGPVSTVMMLDPWLPPATGFPLATRLGLTNSSLQVLHSDTGSTLNGDLPTRVGLSATNAVSVTTPAANTTKWKAKLVPTTGLFSGSFELADTTPKPRVVPFTGVLRQRATAPDALIGDGHYLLPPLTGTAKTTGEIMLKRP